MQRELGILFRCSFDRDLYGFLDKELSLCLWIKNLAIIVIDYLHELLDAQGLVDFTRADCNCIICKSSWLQAPALEGCKEWKPDIIPSRILFILYGFPRCACTQLQV